MRNRNGPTAVPSLVILVSAGFWFYRADRQTDRQPVVSHTDAAKRFAPATVVGVTN